MDTKKNTSVSKIFRTEALDHYLSSQQKQSQLTLSPPAYLIYVWILIILTLIVLGILLWEYLPVFRFGLDGFE